MNNDLARITKLAEECGASLTSSRMENTPYGMKAVVDGATFNKDALLAFEQAVLATKQDALERKCITANEEAMMKEIESLQAKLAMQAEALQTCIVVDGGRFGDDDTLFNKPMVDAALNATQADVDKFMAEKKTEWENGVHVQYQVVGAIEHGGDFIDYPPFPKTSTLVYTRGGVR